MSGQDEVRELIALRLTGFTAVPQPETTGDLSWQVWGEGLVDADRVLAIPAIRDALAAQVQAPEPQGGGLTEDEREALVVGFRPRLRLAGNGVEATRWWADDLATLACDHFERILAARAVPAETLAYGEVEAWKDNYDGMWQRWVECDTERLRLKEELADALMRLRILVPAETLAREQDHWKRAAEQRGETMDQALAESIRNLEGWMDERRARETLADRVRALIALGVREQWPPDEWRAGLLRLLDPAERETP